MGAIGVGNRDGGAGNRGPGINGGVVKIGGEKSGARRRSDWLESDAAANNKDIKTDKRRRILIVKHT